MTATPTIRSASLLSPAVPGATGKTVVAGGDGFALLLATTGAIAVTTPMTAPNPANDAPAAPHETADEAGAAVAPTLPDTDAVAPAFVTADDRLTIAVTADLATTATRSSRDRHAQPAFDGRAGRQPDAARGNALPTGQKPDASSAAKRAGERPTEPSSGTVPDTGATAAAPEASPSTAPPSIAPPEPFVEPAIPEQASMAAPDPTPTTVAPISMAIASDTPMPGRAAALRTRLLASATGDAVSPRPLGSGEASATEPQRDEAQDRDAPAARDAVADVPARSAAPSPAVMAPPSVAGVSSMAGVMPSAADATPQATDAPTKTAGSQASVPGSASPLPAARQSPPTPTVDEAQAVAPAAVPSAPIATATDAAVPATPALSRPAAISVIGDMAPLPAAAATGAPAASPPIGDRAAAPTPRSIRIDPAVVATAPPAPVRLVGGTALQALGATAAAANEPPAPAIAAGAPLVQVASPPAPFTFPADAPAVPPQAPGGSIAHAARPPSAPETPAPILPAAPIAEASTRVAIGTTAPAGQAFAAAIEAADRQDRLAADRGLAESTAAATAITSVAAPSPVAATAGGDQPSLDLRQQGWPAAMVDHIEKLRDAADATSTRIRVVPDALGSIDVSVRRHDDGGVQVSLVADRAQTQALIAEAKPELTRLADERGTRLDVSVGGGTGGAGHFGSQADGRHAPPQAAHRRAPAPAPLSSTDPADPAERRVA